MPWAALALVFLPKVKGDSEKQRIELHLQRSFMTDALQEAQVLAGTRLLTADELAQRLGFSTKHGARTVRQKVKDGSIPVVRINDHHLRFRWPDVMAKLSRLAPDANH